MVWSGLVWSLALCPENLKQLSVVHDERVWSSVPGEEFTYCIHTAGSRLPLGLYHSGPEGERHFWLTWVPPYVRPACAGPPGDSNGHVRGFGHGAP